MKRSFSKKKRQLEMKMAEYRRFLKNDEDWDYNFILRLLRYKLERTRRCIQKNNIVVSAPGIARQIKTVEDLLGRVIEDRYYSEISKDFRKKFGTGRMIFGKVPNGASGVPVTVRYRGENARNAAVIRREVRKLHRKAWNLRRRDLSRAFASMHKNIWGWWD